LPLIADICYLVQNSNALKSWDIEVISERGIAGGKGHAMASLTANLKDPCLARERERALFAQMKTIPFL